MLLFLTLDTTRHNDATKHTHTGDAYVIFESEGDASAAMQAMNKQTLISRWIDLFPVSVLIEP